MGLGLPCPFPSSRWCKEPPGAAFFSPSFRVPQDPIKFSDKCTNKLQCTCLTLPDSEHNGLRKSRTQSLAPGSALGYSNGRTHARVSSLIDGSLKGALAVQFTSMPGSVYTRVCIPWATLSDSWQGYFVGLLYLALASL